MKQFRITLFALALMFIFAAPAFAQQEADAVMGVWYNTEKSAKIEVYKCGERYCGKIIWLKEPTNEEGKPKLDKENPKESLQNRPLMGMNLLSDFEYAGDNEWEDGEIYDPKNGKTYSCILNLEDNGELEVRGYVGFSLMGRTVVWTRAEEQQAG